MPTLPILRTRRPSKAEQARDAARKAGSKALQVAGDGYAAVKQPKAAIAAAAAAVLAFAAGAAAALKRRRRRRADFERPLGPDATAQSVSPPQPDRGDRTPPTGDALASAEERTSG